MGLKDLIKAASKKEGKKHSHNISVFRSRCSEVSAHNNTC